MEHKYLLLRVVAKSGRVDKAISHMGRGMLKMWAMINTSKSFQTFVIDIENENVIFHVTGKTDKISDKIFPMEEIGLTREMLKEVMKS